MPRSPSPPRGYRDSGPSRPSYRDRSFRGSISTPGPSRYAGDDRRRVDDRDRDGYNRNAGWTWVNYQSRQDDRPSGYRGEGGNGKGGSISRGRSRSRSRTITPERERDRSRGGGGSHGRPRTPEMPSKVVEEDRSVKGTPRTPARSRAANSATPEEGQITSPTAESRGLPTRPAEQADTRRRSRSPSPARYRLERRDERPLADRIERDDGGGYGSRRGGYEGYRGRFNNDRGGRGYRGRGRGRGRGGGGGYLRDDYRNDYDRGANDWRERDRGYGRDTATRRSRSRSPVHKRTTSTRSPSRSRSSRSKTRSPPPKRAPSRRSRSRSTTSSYRSSRYSRSPVKRDITASPIPPPRVSAVPKDTEPVRRRPNRFEGLSSQPIVTPAPFTLARPTPVAVPLHGRVPPVGPRSDRIPSGPRSYFAPPPLAPPPPPPAPVPQSPSVAPPSPIKSPTDVPPPRPRDPSPPPPPPPDTPHSAAALTPTTAGARLPWSERKRVSPMTTTFPESRSDLDTTRPHASSSQQQHSEDVEMEDQETPDARFRAPEPEDRPDTPSPPPKAWTPPPAAALQQYHHIASQPTEEQIAEQRRQVEEARIMAELPPLVHGYGGGKWEMEVDRHYALLKPLEMRTLRSQAGMRIAQAILADAELERMAAMERRQGVEAGEAKGSLGMGVLSGV